MAFFKSSKRTKAESGLSLLQGLAILAVIGIVLKVLIDLFIA